MIYTFQYADENERTSIIANNQGKYLLEEQNIQEGNFLIFSDAPRLEDQFAQLKEDNLILMDAIAQMYEDMMAKGTV